MGYYKEGQLREAVVQSHVQQMSCTVYGQYAVRSVAGEELQI